MIEILPDGSINFEGLKVIVINGPNKNGAIGRITLAAPITNGECDEMMEFFRDPLTVLEMEITFDAVIISKRVWISCDVDSIKGVNVGTSTPVLFADYECRSRDLFAQNFRAKTTRNIHLVDSNEVIEMGAHNGKFTADIFMSGATDQIPTFTNSSFQSNISMIFLDEYGDIGSFVVRKVIPFIEDAISYITIPKEYEVVFEHHVLGIGEGGQSISIMTTPCGIKVSDRIYSISECTPELIQYNTMIWDDAAASKIFKTLVRTTFADRDHFYYPVYEETDDRFKMRNIVKSTKTSIYGDSMSYQIPECVAIRLLRKPYLKMKLTPSIGVFDYKFYEALKVYYSSDYIEIEKYVLSDEVKSMAYDLRLPKIIVKVDRDIYDNFYKDLPHGIDPKLAGGWIWLAEEVRSHHLMNTISYELLVCNMQELIIGYW